jgi:hypothetical protein
MGGFSSALSALSANIFFWAFTIGYGDRVVVVDKYIVFGVTCFETEVNTSTPVVVILAPRYN